MATTLLMALPHLGTAYRTTPNPSRPVRTTAYQAWPHHTRAVHAEELLLDDLEPYDGEPTERWTHLAQANQSSRICEYIHQ